MYEGNVRGSVGFGESRTWDSYIANWYGRMQPGGERGGLGSWKQCDPLISTVPQLLAVSTRSPVQYFRTMPMASRLQHVPISLHVLPCVQYFRTVMNYFSGLNTHARPMLCSILVGHGGRVPLLGIWPHWSFRIQESVNVTLTLRL